VRGDVETAFEEVRGLEVRVQDVVGCGGEHWVRTTL